MQVKNILQENQNIIFALLFGSYANGKSNDMSDIDIAIFTDKELDIFEFGMIVSDLEQLSDKKIDLVVLNNLYKKTLNFLLI
ncbi:MAG: hypothetical protein COB17_04140 [Sulfurimonas sp.]|nr:MAG: hypothetical protein COB17_04140 [Sulfurimonas sp.]